jgi:hypothetical protein
MPSYNRGGVFHHYGECGQCHRRFSLTKSHPVIRMSGPAGSEWAVCSFRCVGARGEKMEAMKKKRAIESRAANANVDSVMDQMVSDHKDQVARSKWRGGV